MYLAARLLYSVNQSIFPFKFTIPDVYSSRKFFSSKERDSSPPFSLRENCFCLSLSLSLREGRFYKENPVFRVLSRYVRTRVRSSNFHEERSNATGRHNSFPLAGDSKQLVDLCTVKYIMRRGMSYLRCVKRIYLFAKRSSNFSVSL